MPAPDQAPRSTIGPVACLAFAVGVIVGGGVFTLSGVAINAAGPAALISYLIAGGVMLLSALSFVAVSARSKPGDSGYGPVAELIGPVWRYIVMWAFYINAVAVLAFVLVSFGHYFNDYFVSDVGPLTAGLVAVAGLTALNLGPLDRIGKVETYVVAVKVGLLLVLVGWGLAEIDGGDFTPFDPDGAGGVLETSATLFIAYTGFNIVTNIAGSVRNPERTIPFAVIGSVVISAAIYVGVIVAMLASGVRDFGDAGVAQAADALMGPAGATLIAAAACLSTLSGGNANMLGASEIMVRLVANGDAPPAAARMAASGRPFASVLFVGAIAALMIEFSNLDTIIGVANVAALSAMIIVNFAAVRLARRGWPGRGLRLPGGFLIPGFAMLACLAQFPFFELDEVVLGLAMIAAGLLLYAARHRREGAEGVVERVEHSLEHLATPLLRAMSHHPRLPGRRGTERA